MADDGGFGFAIAKALAEAGASVCVGTWPPALGIFETLLRRGKLDASLSPSTDGSKLELERIYPTRRRVRHSRRRARVEVPPTEALPRPRRLQHRGRLANQLRKDFGEGACLDIVVHSLANGPEVTKPLMETSRAGYLAAHGASAYSMISHWRSDLQPLMRPRRRPSSDSPTSRAKASSSDYGGGMASAKAALEADARMLAFEMGRQPTATA